MKQQSSLTVIVASFNSRKVLEIQSLLGDGFHCVAFKHGTGSPKIVEDADSFAGNAAKKALGFANWIQSQSNAPEFASGRTFVLGDDSGLEVDALKGVPGIHSARFAALDDGRAGNSLDSENNAKLLRLLANVPTHERGARFRCVLALVELFKQGEISHPELFEGACEGRILVSPIGQNGFGYDPLFVPTGFQKSFGELDEATKNQISHRAKAAEKLKAALIARL